MTRINFEEVAIYGEKSGKCGCGVRRTRKQKFWATINPFNKNADGSIRNRDDIIAGLKVKLKAWERESITCDKCKDKAA